VNAIGHLAYLPLALPSQVKAGFYSLTAFPIELTHIVSERSSGFILEVLVKLRHELKRIL